MSKFVNWPEERYSPDAFRHFDPNATDFDLGVARAMIWLSQLAYECAFPSKVTNIGDRWGLEIDPGQIIVRSTGTALTIALLARTHEAAFIAFAGTDPIEIRNWLTNFDVAPTPDGGARGFHKALDLVADDVSEFVDSLPADTPIYMSGHSLGGALAVHAASRLMPAQSVRLRGIYTFGMPRPGYARFAQDYNQRLGMKTFRLVHGFDIVPSVAPAALQFFHVGRRLFAGHKGIFKKSDLEPLPGGSEPGTENLLKSLADTPITALVDLPVQFKTAVLILTGNLSEASGFDLLPSSIRDHIPDRYILATGGTISAF